MVLSFSLPSPVRAIWTRTSSLSWGVNLILLNLYFKNIFRFCTYWGIDFKHQIFGRLRTTTMCFRGW